ncbi:MAG: hypothetical protein AAFP04_10250 [Myxococcota bacterium]
MRIVVASILATGLSLGGDATAAEPNSVVYRAGEATPDPKVSNAEESHAIWIRGLLEPGSDELVRLTFSDDAFFSFDGDKGRLTGFASITDPNSNAGERWLLSATFWFRGQGESGVGDGGPKLELKRKARQKDFVSEWQYFDFGSITLQNDDGDELTLTTKPANGESPLQVGFTASGKNTRFGASGWFFYERLNVDGSSWAGDGDFNIDLDEL